MRRPRLMTMSRFRGFPAREQQKCLPRAGGRAAGSPGGEHECNVANMSVRKRAELVAPSLLQVATEVLVTDPTASLGDVARAAGIGRTTLHKQYPTRHALLVALARDALDVLERTYAESALDPWHGVIDSLSRLTRGHPAGPAGSSCSGAVAGLEPDLAARWTSWTAGRGLVRAEGAGGWSRLRRSGPGKPQRAVTRPGADPLGRLARWARRTWSCARDERHRGGA